MQKSLFATGARLAKGLTISLLRASCNAWNTSTRFHKVVQPCAFCKLDGGDTIMHYFECPVAHEIATSLFPHADIPCMFCEFLVDCIDDLQPRRTDMLIIFCEILLQTFNAMRFNNGRSTPLLLVDGRARALHRKDATCAKVLMRRGCVALERS